MARSRTAEAPATRPRRAVTSASENPSPATARVYGGRSPDERRAARRERLFEAALETFGTKGYAATTIERLCASAGVTARHFYEEYESREALLVATYDRIIARTETAISRGALGIESASPQERLEAAVRAFLDEMLDDPRAARIACLEVVGVSPALERHRRATGRAFATTIARTIGAMRPELAANPARLEATALVVVGGVTELVVDWLDQAERRAPAAVAEDLVSIFGAMIRGYAP